MDLRGVKIGFALTGSFCTFDKALSTMKEIEAQGAELFPIVSYAVDQLDTRFMKAEDLKKELIEISGRGVINTIPGAEPIGPKAMLDILLVCPCTGNTLAKIANAITDTPVTMAVKAHLRNERPVVLAVSTNDGLGLNAKNIGSLLSAKNIYFVPFGQDDAQNKPKSLVSYLDLTINTVKHALNGSQLQALVC